MGVLTSLPEGEEGRKVDLFMTMALDALDSFFRNASPKDVAGIIEALEGYWPPPKLDELSNILEDMAIERRRSSQTPPDA
jgi:hypothetical protein